MANKFIQAWRDFDNDRQEVSYDVSAATTAANYAAFFAALDAWQIGAGGGGGFFDEQTTDAGVAAASPIAQSKSQAILELVDTVTGRAYKKRVPFPEMSKADDGGSNPAFIPSGGLTVFNPSHADYATLQTQVETHLISPLGNPVTLARVYIEE